MTVRIETIGAGGDGVAEAEGAKVFTPYTAPGDFAVVDAEGERGSLVELIEESPLRVAPPCRHFGVCGGCALQHIAREEELRWKREQVREALWRAGVETEVKPVIAAPPSSRRRAVFSVRRGRGAVVLGFNARRSDRIVAVEECAVLAPALSRRLDALRKLAAAIPAPDFDLAVTACDNGLDVNVASSRVEPGAIAQSAGVIAAMRAAEAVRIGVNAEPALTFAAPVICFDGLPAHPPPGAFLQASKEGETALIELVRRAAGSARTVADLFSGCGTFSLPLARGAAVTAADGDPAAIGSLQRAAASAQAGGAISNPFRAAVRDLFDRPFTARELKGFDAVVFDPPRAGAAAQAGEIAKSAAPVVAAVSCNPRTFARDASLLVAGGYTLVEVTPVDQFVYSPHVELVGVFQKR